METQATETTETFDDPFEAFASEVVEADDQEIDTSEATESVDVTSEDDTDDEEAKTKSDDSEDQETETDEQELPPIEHIDDLAEALDMSVKDILATLKIDTIQNGQVVPVTLEEAGKGHQRLEDYSRNMNAFKEKQQAHEEQATAEREELKRQLTYAGQVFHNDYQRLEAQLDSPELLALRQSDPNQYFLYRDEIYRQITAKKSEMESLAATYHENQKKIDEKTKADLDARLHVEFQEKLPAAVQDKGLGKWNEDTNKAVSEYLQGQGYTLEEVSGVADHRDVVMAIKAMKYDEMQKGANAAKKKVSTVRKLQKKGGNKSVQPNRFQQARARMKKSGGDAASTEAAFEALFS